MSQHEQNSPVRPHAGRARFRIGPYGLALGAVWTVIAAGSLGWNLAQVQISILQAARIQARTAFEKDILFRRWNASHGGVYVTVTPSSRPNPYLKAFERDIKTPSGRPLTLVNPAYMTRQVHELGTLESGVIGHITSLKPIRPGNAPDPWEAKALRSFNRGGREVSGVQARGGRDYLRLMRPLITERVCLPCHQAQGYRVGEVRGGISVSVPLAPLTARARHDRLGLIVSHAVLWLLGMLVLGIGVRHLGLRVKERQEAAEAREKLIAELREALTNVRTLRGLVPICASCKKIRDDKGYWQQVEVYVRDHSEAEFSHGLCP
jgi:hypothetical protein